MPKPNRKSDRDKSTRGAAQDYARYSGIAVQMIVILLLGAYAGMWLDERFATGTPYYTIGLTLLGIALALYIPLKGLLK